MCGKGSDDLGQWKGSDDLGQWKGSDDLGQCVWKRK